MWFDYIIVPLYRMHDYDNNNLLDGIEMMGALSHIAPYDVDLDLGKLSEGKALNFNEQQKLKAARERQHDQMNHFTSTTLSLCSHNAPSLHTPKGF